jgi:RecB family exonuclease
MLEKEPESFEYDENSYWPQVSKLLIKYDYDYKKEFKEFIDAGIADRAFSASSINRYLACPRNYLYNDILKWEVKDGNPNSKSYGTSIHKACEQAIKYIQENKTAPDKSQFIKWFKDELSNQPMESYPQRKIYEVRGEKALDEYYCQILSTTPTNLYAQEEKVNYKLENGTKFYGIIDRIDKNEDGTYTIYDYKTGNNKNSKIKENGEHEDYYNQMAWYKYFYEQSTGNKVSLTKFIYPEDFQSKNDGINYTNEEIEAAVDKFKQAVEGIKSHEFEPSYNPIACKYCAYKDFCSLNRI